MAKPQTAATPFKTGDTVETKWGSSWRKSVIKNRSRTGGSSSFSTRLFFEWVEPRRISDPDAMIMLKEGQTITQAVAELSKPNTGFLQVVRLPAALPKPRDPLWYGVTRLSAGTAVDVPVKPSAPAAQTGVPSGI